jgi:2-C-methyl-D-erythritol 4-phosphate cytidylyltransferase/2-C-methyl-D-erythritol 2,4-cyclodiphosphate synthase
MPAAILAAAGRGERFGSPKQFHPLAGKPLLSWSLDVLLEAGCSPVVVVLAVDQIEQGGFLAGSPEVVVVEGGDVRQRSVGAGLERIDSDVVVVHDAARPFVTPELVRRVVAAVGDADGVIAAVPVDETVKRVQGPHVLETIDRSDLWRAQTPQAFKTESLRDAHRRADLDHYVGTDDAELVERCGGKIAIVEGLRANLKITFPEDLGLAEAIAEARR